MTSNETRLIVAIGSLIMPEGIYFNVYQELTFKKLLTFSRNMWNGYQTPNRNLISKDILDTIND